MRAACRDSRPLRARPSHQTVVAFAAVGGLEVVDPVEAAVAELPAQRQKPAELPPARPLVDPHLVEPAACPGELGIGSRRPQGQTRRPVIPPDRLVPRQRLNEIAEPRLTELREGKDWVRTCKKRGPPQQ